MPTLSIGVDKPYYSPGDTINGELILENREKLKSKYLKIAILGEVNTHWTEQESRSTSNSDGSSDSKSETIHYYAKVEIVNQYKMFWHGNEAQNIPIGTSAYYFSFHLPPICPPSFEGTYGKVTYKLKATLQRSWMCNTRHEKVINVTSMLNLNTIRAAFEPVEELRSKNTGLIFKNGVVEVMVTLPKQGFLPGEHIPVSISIINNSTKPVKMLRVKLSQHSHNSAYRKGNEMKAHTREEFTSLVKIERKMEVPMRAKAVEMVQLMVPYDSVQCFGTDILKVSYFVNVKVSTTSTFKSDVLVEIPVIIGAVCVELGELAEFMNHRGAPPSYKEAITEKM